MRYTAITYLSHYFIILYIRTSIYIGIAKLNPPINKIEPEAANVLEKGGRILKTAAV